MACRVRRAGGPRPAAVRPRARLSLQLPTLGRSKQGSKAAAEAAAAAALKESQRSLVAPFTLAAATLAGVGAAEALAPGAVASQLVGLEGPDFLALNTVCNVASFTPLAAGSAAACAMAARDGRLGSAAYASLELALLLGPAATAATAAGACALGGCTPTLAAAAAAAAAPPAYASLKSLSLRPAGVDAAALASKVWRDVREGCDVLAKGGAEGGYVAQYLSANLAITFLVGGSFAFSPGSPLAQPAELVPYETVAASLLRREFGIAALFYLGPALYLLQSAAGRPGQLKAGTFRLLSLAAGLSTLSVDGCTLVGIAQIAEALGGGGFDSVQDQSQLPNLISAVAIAGLQAGVYFVQALGGQVEEEEAVPYEEP